MTRPVIGSAFMLMALVAAVGAQDSPAPIPYVASVKRNATGIGGQI